ncbi:hypothetical protein [Gordonia crocea]|uniref:Uncharacterized protein n=1 Tax=Gordonia crocea TaxID=589162 RepID=A0A7I9V038_9ACTN|nr:hypothetical protein [Gordonia crocea]GED98491.1 hypothetical protein nbrc107697_25300 [Gordonia crocea]
MSRFLNWRTINTAFAIAIAWLIAVGASWQTWAVVVGVAALLLLGYAVARGDQA